jgi:NAD(P)-dependent dehydrogenase (short-subunit alcohol dehydrogenase family)
VELRGSVAVVTGGASGIGRALCRRFAEEAAEAVVVVDLEGDAAELVASELRARGAGALALEADVGRPEDVSGAVATALDAFGRVDLFCSNAGIAVGGGVEVPDATWQRAFEVNVMAHVWAARAVLPSMLERRHGYLLHTASAAGLLTNLGAAPYTVTKHAVVGLAEWLAITYGDLGIKVSCLCPQGVRTPMLLGDASGPTGPAEAPSAEAPSGEAPGLGRSAVLAGGRLLEPEDVAEAVVQGLREERFLILPHPEVAEYVRRKAEDPDRWLRGMRRLQARLVSGSDGA